MYHDTYVTLRIKTIPKVIKKFTLSHQQRQKDHINAEVVDFHNVEDPTICLKTTKSHEFNGKKYI